jgi:hypothetical protein
MYWKVTFTKIGETTPSLSHKKRPTIRWDIQIFSVQTKLVDIVADGVYRRYLETVLVRYDLEVGVVGVVRRVLQQQRTFLGVGPERLAEEVDDVLGGREANGQGALRRGEGRFAMEERQLVAPPLQDVVVVHVGLLRRVLVEVVVVILQDVAGVDVLLVVLFRQEHVVLDHYLGGVGVVDFFESVGGRGLFC